MPPSRCRPHPKQRQSLGSELFGSPRAQKLLPQEGCDVGRQVPHHRLPRLPFLLPPASSWVFIFVVLPGHPGKGQGTTRTVCRDPPTWAADGTVAQTQPDTEMLPDGSSSTTLLPDPAVSAGRGGEGEAPASHLSLPTAVQGSFRHLPEPQPSTPVPRNAVTLTHGGETWRVAQTLAQPAGSSATS